MRHTQSERMFDEHQHVLQLAETCDNHIHIDMDIAIIGNDFVEFQKDIFNEFFSQLLKHCSIIDHKHEKNAKVAFEQALQTLNGKLTMFADKIAKVDYFPIKGAVKVVVGETLMASLIGNVSLMIFREQNLFYATNNDYQQVGKIDFFSEFVEGDIQDTDLIVLIGNDIYTVFDKKEIKSFHTTFDTQGQNIEDFLEQAVGMRIDTQDIGFLISNTYQTTPIQDTETSSTQNIKKKKRKSMHTAKQKFLVASVTLGVIILILLWSALQGNKPQPTPTIANDQGQEITITPDQIKKDMNYFQRLDPTSDEKAHMYRQITEKLDYLESAGYRPEDVITRRRILEKTYNQGFNIVYETSLHNFDDELNNTQAQILAFNQGETETLMTPTNLVVNSNITVAGTKGALIGLVNQDIRGTLLSFNEEDEALQTCSSNILRDGIYCATANSNIYNLTKANYTPVTTESAGGFPSNITSLGIFGKTNLYVLNQDTFLNADGVYISRYRNLVGSQTQFQAGADYQLTNASGATTQQFNNMAIDGTFLVRDATSNAIKQLRRQGTTFNLNERVIKTVWGDSASTRSANTKILSHINTKYIYLFDPDAQDITIYTSNGLKTNDAYSTNFTLTYVMKFKFALSNETVIDVTINENDGNKSKLYILTDLGVYQINAGGFITDILENETT